jgi:RHS repeat-associated protein
LTVQAKYLLKKELTTELTEKTVYSSYPFGMPMPNRQYSLSSSKYRFGFNGKENDPEAEGQQDYGMRIYDSRLGRFKSTDPLTKSYPMLTPYQFASNTPIQAIDLDGLEAFYVHGTWANPNTFSKLSVSTINDVTNNSTSVHFKWSGGNTDRARRKAARDLANHIMKNRDPNQPLTIVGHSHGGNVGIMAANILKKRGVKVDNLITINTPVREYQLNDGAADKHVQISHKLDPVQLNGGNARNIPDGAQLSISLPSVDINKTNNGISATLNTGGIDVDLNKDGMLKLTGESGPAGQRFEGAMNIMLPATTDYHNSHNMPDLWKTDLNKAINTKIDMSQYNYQVPTREADNTRVAPQPR